MRCLPHVVVLATTVAGIGAVAITVDVVPAAAAGGTCAAGLGTAELNRLFAGQVDEYVGLDALRAYPLPDGRVLWLFQDAFFSPSGAPLDNLGAANFAHNAGLVQQGTCFRALHGATSAGDRCPNTGRASLVGGEQTIDCTRWFWPMGGAMGADGLLNVFFALVGNAEHTGANTGAAPDGVWIARFDPDTLAVNSFVPAPDDDGTLLYGWSVENDGAFSYLFGHSYDQFNLPDRTSPAPDRTFLARVPLGRFDVQPEYWNGTTFASDRSAATPVQVGPDQLTYAMQPRLIDGVWVSVTKPGDWFGTDVVIDTAPAPQGPWTRVRTMALPTKTLDGSTNTYLPHLLPWRSPLGNLVVVVSHNAWQMNPVALNRPWLYRPTFFEVEPPPAMAANALMATTSALGFVASAPRRALDTRAGIAMRGGETRRVALGGVVADGAQVAAVDLVGVDPAEPPASSRPGRAIRPGPGHRTSTSPRAAHRPRSHWWGCRRRATSASSRRPISIWSSTCSAGTCPDRRRARRGIAWSDPPDCWTHGSPAASCRQDSRDASRCSGYDGGRHQPGSHRTGHRRLRHRVSVRPASAGDVEPERRRRADAQQPRTGRRVAVRRAVRGDQHGHAHRRRPGGRVLQPESPATEGWWYHATTPTRLVDSRDGVGVPVGPITRTAPGARAVPANSLPGADRGARRGEGARGQRRSPSTRWPTDG